MTLAVSVVIYTQELEEDVYFHGKKSEKGTMGNRKYTYPGDTFLWPWLPEGPIVPGPCRISVEPSDLM